MSPAALVGGRSWRHEQVGRPPVGISRTSVYATWQAWKRLRIALRSASAFQWEALKVCWHTPHIAHLEQFGETTRTGGLTRVGGAQSVCWSLL